MSLGKDNNIRLTERQDYTAHFSWSYLLPKYWGLWLLGLLLLVLAYVPWQLRDKLAGKLGIMIGRKAKKQRHRANVNLMYCFPEYSELEREQIIDNMFAVAGKMMLSAGELCFRSKRFIRHKTVFTGLEHIIQAHENGQKFILLVPHAWAIDLLGIVLSSYGILLGGPYKPHKNPMIDWAWTSMRLRFGGKSIPRQHGIKAFINAVRGDYNGLYAPDEDYGPNASKFVKFFATEKATIKGLQKIAIMTKASIIPVFPRYNGVSGRYEIEILPSMQLTGDGMADAREINKVIEYFVTPTPEQYMWIFRLLRTRRDNSDIYS